MFVKIHSPQMPSKMLLFFHVCLLTLQVVIFVTFIFFLKVQGYNIQLIFVAFYIHKFDICQSSWPGKSTAWVCGHSLAGIVGLNPASGMDICFLCILCVVQVHVPVLGQSLIQRILPNVCVCVCVCVTECHYNLYTHNV
jgi:hypothetical protein